MQLLWCRAITQRRSFRRRPLFRGECMPTRQGIGMATGMGGAATATDMAGGTKQVRKEDKEVRVRAATKKGLRRPMQPES